MVHALEVRVERANVLHFLGYPAGRAPRPNLQQLIDEVLPEARALVRARGAFRRVGVAETSGLGLAAPDTAASVALGLCTAGEQLEARVSTLASSDATRALLFDAAGSAAAEEAADALSALITAAPGPTPAAPAPVEPRWCRVSPGYGDWELAAQPAVFARLPHEEVGVALLPSLLMRPRKSISFAMWFDVEGRPLVGHSGCARCTLRSCRYRREPAATREAP